MPVAHVEEVLIKLTLTLAMMNVLMMIANRTVWNLHAQVYMIQQIIIGEVGYTLETYVAVSIQMIL
jgi:hypothetical protein